MFLEYAEHVKRYGEVSVLDTPTFLYGLKPGESTTVKIEQGRTLYIRLLSVSDPDENGCRTIFFELNGQIRTLDFFDRSIARTEHAHPKVDPKDDRHIGASMPGRVLKVFVNACERIERGTPLLATEAMKMELPVQALQEGTVAEVLVKEGNPVEAGDLLVVLGKAAL